MRQYHNFPRFLAFVDLVKEFDMVNHDIIIENIEQYGCRINDLILHQQGVHIPQGCTKSGETLDKDITESGV